MFRRREAPAPVGATTQPAQQTAAPTQGGTYSAEPVRVGSPDAALTISAVYRAVELRAKTLAQFQMQYQRLDSMGGNFVPMLWGPGKVTNYLLQIQPNPLISASTFWEQLTIDRLMRGNGYALIERNEYGDPVAFWPASGSYNIMTGTYALTWLSEQGMQQRFDVPRRDVLHLPNTYRHRDGIHGISTLAYAFDCLSLAKTEARQAMETAAKGGRVKLLIGEDTTGTVSPIGRGMYDPKQMKQYAREVNDELYQQDVVSPRGLDKVQNISMSAQDQQMIELLNMSVDDVARFFGTPRPLLMADTNSHYTTPVQATLEYNTRTIQPDATLYEQELTRKLLQPGDFGARRFHMCDQYLFRLDKETQAKVDAMRLATGTATTNELRKLYDMPAVPNGDIVYVSTNLAELGSEKLRSGTSSSIPSK